MYYYRTPFGAPKRTKTYSSQFEYVFVYVYVMQPVSAVEPLDIPTAWSIWGTVGEQQEAYPVSSQ